MCKKSHSNGGNILWLLVSIFLVVCLVLSACSTAIGSGTNPSGEKEEEKEEEGSNGSTGNGNGGGNGNSGNNGNDAIKTPDPIPVAPPTGTTSAAGRNSAVTNLHTAISTAKYVTRNSGTTGVVQLTSEFYDAVNGSGDALVIDAGATRNDDLYIIKGLGITAAAKSLNVGILLANDKVTLQDVKFAITDPIKAAVTQKFGDYLETRYTAAVSIGRSNGGAGATFFTGANMASKMVTVQGCSITIDYSGDTTYSSSHEFNAGIYICADQSADSPKTIKILNNTVLAKGRGLNAAQALSIRYYDPTMVITNNTLNSGTGGTEAVNAPAAGLFMNIIPDTIRDSTATPQITGNKLNGKNIDFYVNINSTGNYVGIPALFKDKFGTYESTWAATGTATDKDSLYKKLYNQLIPQAANQYAGLFFMSFGSPAGKWDGYCFAMEAWQKSVGVGGQTGKVNAVDYWGAAIISGATVYDADGKNIDHGPGKPSDKTDGGYKGRLTIDTSTNKVSDRDTDIFHWNPTDTDNTYPRKP